MHKVSFNKFLLTVFLVPIVSGCDIESILNMDDSDFYYDDEKCIDEGCNESDRREKEESSDKENTSEDSGKDSYEDKIDRIKEVMKVFSTGGIILATVFWIPALLLSKEILLLFKVAPDIIEQGLLHFRVFYSIFVLYGVMVMSITFFQAIANAKKAGIIVMFRQLILFVPMMILLPKFFGIDAVWFTQPLVDFIMIGIGILMMMKELKQMESKDYGKNK